MTEATTGRRSVLEALKVPFDLKGLALGAVAWVILHYTLRDMNIVRLLTAWLGAPFSATGISPFLDWPTAGRLALVLMVFAILGVACCRIAAMRLARDEGVNAGDSIVFSMRSLGSTLGAYVFLALALGLLYGCLWLGGFASQVPVVGVFIIPLAMLGSLLFFLLLLGTVFGLPLVYPGLATEKNGCLDAVSRSFSYAYGRPALYVLFLGTVTLFTTLLFAVAESIPGIMVEVMASGIPDGAEAGDALRVASQAAARFEAPRFDAVVDMMGVTLGEIEPAHRPFGWAAWFGHTLFGLVLRGWAVYYMFGGMTAAYFALRRDVDGTEDEEIWIDGESDQDLGPPEEPERVAPSDEASAIT